ncbi:MAG: hypothetical protein EBR00_11215 [Gammaproteobacteria bacterium]|nr:hypothetical protein [Gammaproteobacteria bacterium]
MPHSMHWSRSCVLLRRMHRSCWFLVVVVRCCHSITGPSRSGGLVAVQPKVDGASVALRYFNGRLVAAWTRSGIDCTEVLRDVVPKQVVVTDEFEVRGELWGLDGRQSTPAAALRRGKAVSGGLAYAAFGGAFQERTEVDAMAWLGDLGFDCVDSLLCTRLQEVQGLQRNGASGSCGIARGRPMAWW